MSEEILKEISSNTRMANNFLKCIQDEIVSLRKIMENLERRIEKVENGLLN